MWKWKEELMYKNQEGLCLQQGVRWGLASPQQDSDFTLAESMSQSSYQDILVAEGELWHPQDCFLTCSLPTVKAEVGQKKWVPYHEGSLLNP